MYIRLRLQKLWRLPLALALLQVVPSARLTVASAANANTQLGAAPAELLTKLKASKLATDPRWLSLVHYKKNVFGYKSYVDSTNFFLAPTGKTHPDREIEATLNALFAPVVAGHEKEHPQCRFPARRTLLVEALGIAPTQLPVVECKDYLEYTGRLRAKSVSLIFSSFYVNNPSSAFGHLFLKINSAQGSQSNDRQLLDFGINYAADVDTSNSLVYSIKGLLGLFPGVYTAVPYYYKVREYNDFESRDLWEYDLNMSQAEVDRLVANSWELGPTHIDYFYLDENCATHTITLLEAAVPQRRLDARLPNGLIIMPTDGLRDVAESPGFVKEIHYRPSIRTQFFSRLQLLNPEQRKFVGQGLEQLKLTAAPANWTKQQQAVTYDALIDGLDFSYAKEFLRDESGPKQFKQAVLVERAHTAVVDDTVVIHAESSEPHRGHNTSRAQFLVGSRSGYGSGPASSGKAFGDFRYRVGLQDSADPTLGYFDQAAVEFGIVGIRIEPSGKNHDGPVRPRLREVSLMSVASYIDYNEFQHKPSWRFELGATRYRNPLCNECLAVHAEGGFGVTFKLTDQPKLFVFALAETDLGVGRFDRGDMALGLGPRAGFRLGLTESLNWFNEGYYRWYLYPKLRRMPMLRSRVRLGFARNYAFDLGVQAWRHDIEYVTGLSLYF